MLLYITTDAIFELEIDPASVTVTLIDTQNVTHHFESNTFEINCEKTPVEVPIVADLSKPMLYTKGEKLDARSSLRRIVANRPFLCSWNVEFT